MSTCNICRLSVWRCLSKTVSLPYLHISYDYFHWILKTINIKETLTHTFTIQSNADTAGSTTDSQISGRRKSFQPTGQLWPK